VAGILYPELVSQVGTDERAGPWPGCCRSLRRWIRGSGRGGLWRRFRGLARRLLRPV